MDFKTIKWENGDNWFELKVRNIGESDSEILSDSQLQFELETTPKLENKKRKFISFAIPHNKVDEFFKAIK